MGVECRVPSPSPSPILYFFLYTIRSLVSSQSLSIPPFSFYHSYSSLYNTLPPSYPLDLSPPPPPLFQYLPCRLLENRRSIKLGLRRGPPPLLPPCLARFARILQPHRPSERREQTRRRRTQAQHRREPRDSTTQSPVPLSCF